MIRFTRQLDEFLNRKDDFVSESKSDEPAAVQDLKAIHGSEISRRKKSTGFSVGDLIRVDRTKWKKPPRYMRGTGKVYKISHGCVFAEWGDNKIRPGGHSPKFLIKLGRVRPKNPLPQRGIEVPPPPKGWKMGNKSPGWSNSPGISKGWGV